MLSYAHIVRLFRPTSCLRRIVVTSDMMSEVVKDSAEVYNYMLELNLSLSLVKKKKKKDTIFLWKFYPAMSFSI